MSNPLKISTNKILITNKTPKPTCFHNLKSQMYLADDAPLTQRGITSSQSQSLQSLSIENNDKGAKNQYSSIITKDPNQKSRLQIPDDILDFGNQNKSSKFPEENEQNISPRDNQHPLSQRLSDKLQIGTQQIQLNNNYNTALQQTAASTNILSPQSNAYIQTPLQKKNQEFEKSLQQTEKLINSARNQESKNLINLENVLLVEDKLWTILESFRYLQHQALGQRPSTLTQEQAITVAQKKQADIAVLCEEWWEITHEDNLNYLDRLFKDEIVRRSVRQSIILELLSVTICYAITSEKSSDQDAQLSLSTLTNLKNLLFYTHQNFLVLIDVIIHRLPPESSHNIWAHSLQAILLNKSSKKLLHQTGKSKGGIADNAAPLLIQNNEAVGDLIRALSKSSKEDQMKTQLNKPVFQCCLGLLKKITKHSVSQVRDHLFSLLEQFTTHLLQKQNQHINQKNNIVDNQDDSDYLPVVYPPFLPPLSQRQQDKMYTLVLDLDETLIHYFEMGSEGGHFLIRPGAEKFLKEMSQLYEVVIFTAAMQDYADWVLDQIDPNGCIKYRLYRQHATQTGAVFIKDLSKLGRDISRVIIVDNVAENFQKQPDNGIFIRSWFDDMTDTALEELGPLLKEIVRKQVPDVRVALRRFRDQMIEQLEKGISNPIMTLD